MLLNKLPTREYELQLDYFRVLLMLQKDATPPASSEVSKMREIIKKHVDHPVHTWKNMYKKLE